MSESDLKPGALQADDGGSAGADNPPANVAAYESPNASSRNTPLDFSDDLEEARHLKKDLEDLLTGVETAHLKAEVKAHISKLNAWAGRYVEGLDAAQQLGAAGSGMLEEARVQISTMLDEYLRLEGEGGQVATPEQSRLIDELNRTLRRIRRLQTAMEGQFTDTV